MPPARGTRLRGAALAAAAAVALTGLAGAAAAARNPGFDGPTLAPATAPPDFALRDQRGELVRLGGQRGHVVLLTFLYTHCPDVCPLTAVNLDRAVRSLGAAGARAEVLAVSVDPAGDTPRAVRTFVREHRLGPEFHYLTGRAAILRAIWRAYNVKSLRAAGDAVDHTLYTLLIDRTGKARVLFDATAAAATVAHDARLLL